MVVDQNGERDAHIEVNTRVRVYPGTDAESTGVVVEDFGEMTAEAVDIGDCHFADPARRWAVLLDAGTLVFTDTDQLRPRVSPSGRIYGGGSGGGSGPSTGTVIGGSPGISTTVEPTTGGGPPGSPAGGGGGASRVCAPPEAVRARCRCSH